MPRGRQSERVYLRPDGKLCASYFLVCGGPLFSGDRSPGKRMGWRKKKPSVFWALAH